jgi:hypothetical protein
VPGKVGGHKVAAGQLPFLCIESATLPMRFRRSFRNKSENVALGMLYIRGSRFLSYNFLQFAIDGKNNSKTKVEKAFFFIFMSSYAEMS